uniref:Lipoprotein n=1 Tax=Pseudomonas graminis TaxID=158627 RepID=A0A7C2ATX7_9PSED
MGIVLKTFISLWLSLTLLAGCSQIGLTYRHLDFIIPWSLNDYLDMNASQKDWLDERLKEHLSWHCTTQIPGYLDWLDRLQGMVENNQVNQEQLEARTAEARQAIATLSKEITPSAVELLRQLDDQQVGEMQTAFAKDLRKHEDEFVDQPLDKQISERAQRMEKRLTPWMGKLNAAQQGRVMQWSTSLGEQNRLWIDNRAHWQSLLLAAVKQRNAADFDQKIANLLQDRQTFWTPEYRATYDHTEQAAISLIADLMAQSTADQRQKLLAKIADVRKDFTDLSCYKSMKKAS